MYEMTINLIKLNHFLGGGSGMIEYVVCFFFCLLDGMAKTLLEIMR